MKHEAEQLSILPEPELEFRFKQKLHDPHDGLALYGPYDGDAPSHPKSITYGVLGTSEGIAAFEQWSQAMNQPIIPGRDQDPRLWPPFPGFQAAFWAKWPTLPAWIYEIDGKRLLEACRNRDANKRAFDVVNEYLEGIRVAKKRDEAFNVMVCIVPDEVYKNCRPESKVIDGIGFSLSMMERKLRGKGQKDFFEEYEPEQYQLSVDFRRQLKARAMEYDVPLQIVRESTLRLELSDKHISRDLSPLSDRAWNLSTTLYYKSGGKPWRLSTAREGVCYIGIAFRRTGSSEKGSTACCAAQMFLDSGDGIVFLGEYGPWYSPENHQYHLSPQAARKLLTGVLTTYEELEGKRLTEIFLHSRSSISKEEFNGYRQACPNGVNVIGIRVRLERNGLSLFRQGAWPVMRGTFWKASERRAFLWGSGFKPRLGTYDGWEIPIPLRIDVEHGDADIGQVVMDIFGLTKLNYNACKLGDSQPVTIGFSDAVGEILVSNPSVRKRSPNFKFYI